MQSLISGDAREAHGNSSQFGADTCARLVMKSHPRQLGFLLKIPHQIEWRYRICRSQKVSRYCGYCGVAKFPFSRCIHGNMSKRATDRWLSCCVIAIALCQLPRGFADAPRLLPRTNEFTDSDSQPYRLVDAELVETILPQPVNVQTEYLSVDSSLDDSSTLSSISQGQPVPIGVGYDGGFVIASEQDLRLGTDDYPYRLKINGWGQLRNTVLVSDSSNRDVNQLQLKRARIVLSGNAFSKDLAYFVQLDGRSNAADTLRILDYYFAYDLSHVFPNAERGTFGIKAGLYKMPFSLARQLSGKELEFADRSMASIYFDVNRSLAFGLYGENKSLPLPIHWELALFNGLVTGGAETGSSGTLDNNNAFSGRIHMYPAGDWGAGDLADLTNHQTLATRIGTGFAVTKIDRIGSTEFSALRVVDSGRQLSELLPNAVNTYNVSLFSVDASLKYHGLSMTTEYYFRNISGFRGSTVPDLFDHGFWLQCGKFLIPQKLELLTRWSRVTGNSGTLGAENQSSDELACGGVWYFRQQHAKLTLDATHLNGATINSSALDISSGDVGWLYRTQLQFSF